MLDNKGSNKEYNQVEAPTNAFDAIIELSRQRQDIATKYIVTTDETCAKKASEVLGKIDEDILHLKLIAADQFDSDVHLEEEDC